METELIRPSSLPKLAHCRAFKGRPGTSPAAARGTAIDAAIRLIMQDEPCPALDPADVEAARWGVEELKRLADGETVYTSEIYCRAKTPFAEIAPGTMDAYCPAKYWLADIKTGQIRDYSGQLCAYAFALMEAFNVDSWTAFAIFVDQRKTITYIFNREDAARRISNIIHAENVATPCEYCEWCAKYDDCEALQKAVKAALDVKKDNIIEQLKTDEELASNWLATFTQVCKIAESVKQHYRAKIEAGEQLSRFTLTHCSPARTVKAADLQPLVDKRGAGFLLDLLGSVKAEKIAAYWQESFGEALPEDIIINTPGAVRFNNKTKKK